MADVKWIKLNTHMFEDEKIKLIETMPDADTILVIWIKLLAQAGKTNASGYIYLNENIPYTDEMLSTIFNRPLGSVRLALKTFQQFGMIDISDDEFISISNWEKHQNVAGLEKIREQTRQRVAKHRESKKLGVTDDVTLRNATDIELEEDKKKNKKEKVKKKYADRVSMTSEEYSKLVEQFGEEGSKDRIENLNLYKGSTGKTYKDDYLTILAWERKNKKNAPKTINKEAFNLDD